MPGFLKTRLDNLYKTIADSDELLNQLREIKKAAVGDPISRRKFEIEYNTLKSDTAEWEEEYSELQTSIATYQVTDPTVPSQMKNIEQKLSDLQKQLADSTALLQGEVVSSRDQTIAEVQVGVGVISKKLDAMQEQLLQHYDAGQQELLKSVVARIDEKQVATLNELLPRLTSIDYKQGAANTDLGDLLNTLDKLKATNVLSAPVKNEIEKVEAAAGEEKAKTGLKLALPLIPGILDLSANSFDPTKASFNLNLGIVKYDATVEELLAQLKGIWTRITQHANGVSTAN